MPRQLVPRRIGILLATLEGGGAEPVLRRWGHMLQEQGHDVVLLVTHESSAPPGFDGMEVEATPRRGRLPVLDVARGISEVATRRGIDLVITGLANPNLTALLAKQISRGAFQVVISQHDIASEFRRYQGGRQELQWKALRRLAGGVDAVIAVSHPVAANLVADLGVPANRVSVIPNICLDEASSPVVRPRPASAEGGLALVVPGRLVPVKRPGLALDVALALRKRGMDVRVEFFGSGELEAELHTLAEDLQVPTVFHGWVDEWQQYVPADGVVFLPSASEGFGNVLVEAAFRGVPAVVSSSAMGVSDACVPGITAALASTDAPEALASAVIEASNMVIPDVEDWFARFRPPAVAKELGQLVDDLSSRRNSPK